MIVVTVRTSSGPGIKCKEIMKIREQQKGRISSLHIPVKPENGIHMKGRPKKSLRNMKLEVDRRSN